MGTARGSRNGLPNAEELATALMTEARRLLVQTGDQGVDAERHQLGNQLVTWALDIRGIGLAAQKVQDEVMRLGNELNDVRVVFRDYRDGAERRRTEWEEIKSRLLNVAASDAVDGPAGDLIKEALNG
jgi:hypothetical protein